jgi:hypothetical protein
MKPLTKSLILLVVIGFYSLLYIATTPPERCFEDCQKLSKLNDLLRKDRNYLYGVHRCTSRYSLDTLCINVKDTTGVNWNLLADTVCLYAKSVGLSQQMVLVLNNAIYPPDTLARKKCP